MAEKATSPQDATRTNTFGSTNSDENVAIPPEKGDVGGLLVERLRAWKHLVAYLEAYVTQTENVHKVLGKEYEKVLKTVQEPLREGHHFDQSAGGTASLFENLRANTVVLSSSNTETASLLKSTVLPMLERLHKEIKDRAKHVKSECDKGSKAVAKARNATQSHIELLGQHAAALESVSGVSAGGHSGLHLAHTNTGGKPKPENDPYLLKQGVVHRLVKQVQEENVQRNDLLGVQNHFQQFETYIVQTVQAAMASFYQVAGGQADKVKQIYGDITMNVQNLPPDFEWAAFIARYSETLVDPASQPRSVDSIKFANQDHSSTKPVMEGILGRKGKIMRSYNSAYYILTPSKYLHEFKDSNFLNKDQDPEMSLYLPECTIGALSKAPEGKFVIAGKDAGSAMKGLSGKHEYAFKAGTNAEGQKWYEAISTCAGTKTQDTPVTPASTVDPAQPPAYERHPSQESGITRSDTVASRGSAPGAPA